MVEKNHNNNNNNKRQPPVGKGRGCGVVAKTFDATISPRRRFVDYRFTVGYAGERARVRPAKGSGVASSVASMRRQTIRRARPAFDSIKVAHGAFAYIINSLRRPTHFHKC